MAINLSIPLILLLITGIYCISTVSKVSVKTGASVSVPCLYRPKYRDNVKYLCKRNGWPSSCPYAVKTSTQQSSEYSISDDKNKNIFTVTLKQINKNADYQCAVEIDYGADDGSNFRLSVTRGTPSLYVDSQEVTGFIGGNTTINCRYSTSGRMKWCKLGSTCVTEGSGSIDGTRVTMNTSADNVFNVIMTDLRPESSGWYYCVRGDFQMPVHLTVAVKPAGIHHIKVFSKIPVKSGASVSVPCLYSSQYKNNVKYLCKGYYWSTCSRETKTNSQQMSEKYSVSDRRNQTIFTVMIKDTDKTTDYWCAVEIDSHQDVAHDFRLLVTKGFPSLYVDSQEVTGFIGGNTTINCRYRNSGGMKWCKLGSTCVTEGSGSIDGTRVTMNTRADNVFSVIMTDLRPESSGWYYCVRGDFQMPVHLTVAVKPAGVLTSNPVTVAGENATSMKEENSSESNMTRLKKYLVPLLVMTVAVALFIWFKVRSKCANSATSEQSEDEVTYTDVRFRRKLSSQTFHGDNDTEVVYSSVVRRQ